MFWELINLQHMKNVGISVYLLHWHFISFTVTNTLDWVTFLVQNSKFPHLVVCLTGSMFSQKQITINQFGGTCASIKHYHSQSHKIQSTIACSLIPVPW